MHRLRLAIRFGFMTCSHCGSYLPKESSLCASCEDKIFQLIKPRVDFIHGWTVRSLFQWNPGESDLISNLVLGLKGSLHGHAWAYWSKVFLKTHYEYVDLKGSTIVSGPAKSMAASDHAYHWAKGLSQDFHLPFLSQIYAKPGDIRQRNKTKHERARGVQLVKRTGFRADPLRRWVLADDVFTTGETARSVFKALGAPSRFEVWCLARRTQK